MEKTDLCIENPTTGYPIVVGGTTFKKLASRGIISGKETVKPCYEHKNFHRIPVSPLRLRRKVVEQESPGELKIGGRKTGIIVNSSNVDEAIRKLKSSIKWHEKQIKYDQTHGSKSPGAQEWHEKQIETDRKELQRIQSMFSSSS